MIQKYAIIDTDNFPIGFYSSDINKNIPSDAIEITDEQWKYFLSDCGNAKLINNQIVPYTPQTPVFDSDNCRSQIKNLATQIILTIADENQQRNMLAYGLEIADKKADGIPITEAETKMNEDILAVWTLIKALRNKSNQLETTYINRGVNLTSDNLITIENALKQAAGLS